jgi:hypothetical protein
MSEMHKDPNVIDFQLCKYQGMKTNCNTRKDFSRFKEK